MNVTSRISKRRRQSGRFTGNFQIYLVVRRHVHNLYTNGVIVTNSNFSFPFHNNRNLNRTHDSIETNNRYTVRNWFKIHVPNYFHRSKSRLYTSHFRIPMPKRFKAQKPIRFCETKIQYHRRDIDHSGPILERIERSKISQNT